MTNERSRQKPSNSGGEAAGPFLLLRVLLLRHARTPHTLHRVRVRDASAFPRQPLPFPRHTPLPPLRGLFFMPCTTRHTILPRPTRHPPGPPPHSRRSFTSPPSLGSRGPPVLIHKGPLSLITIVAAAAGVLCCRLDTPRKLYGGSKKLDTRGRHPHHYHIGRAVYDTQDEAHDTPTISWLCPRGWLALEYITSNNI